MSGGQLVEAVVDEEALAGLVERVRGPVLMPGQDGYDEARAIQNGLIDRRPGLIVRCTGTADVVEAVNFAREHELLLSVKGGGHNVAGNCLNDGGIVVDMSPMRAVHVDPATRRARVGGGATWADVDRETQLHGLAAPGGVVSTTGVAGLTLHGGMGHLRRKHGLSIDNLVSVEVVTADGEIRTASESENEELFWAIRGAGSNFGVVTWFEFALHPVGPAVMLCAPFYRLEDAPSVLPAWRDFMDAAPEEISSLAVLWSVQPSEPFPQELWGTPVVILGTVHCGQPEEGERAVQPLRELAEPVMDMSQPMPFTVVQSAFDPFFPKGSLYYWKSLSLEGLEQPAIEDLVGYANSRPTPRSDIPIWHQGGAMSRVDAADTAFGARDQPFLVTFEASWSEPSETDAHIEWARGGWQGMHKHSDGSLYLNFPGFGEEKGDLVRAAYGDNYERLTALKAEYDPSNLFRMNLNIGPSPQPAGR